MGKALSGELSCPCDRSCLNSSVLSVPTYGVYVSQLVRYVRACFKYQDFADKRKLLNNKLFSKDYHKAKLVSTIKGFYGRHDLIDSYNYFRLDGLSRSIVWLSNTGFFFSPTYIEDT